MLPLVLGALGVVELLFPDRLLQFYTRLAYEEPEEFEMRPWVSKAARVEGVVLLLFAARWAKRRRARTSTPEADATVTEIAVE